MFRSRYLLLGAVALGFGLSVLAFNFTMEYTALDGETPLTELPSFKSMLRNTSLDHGVIQASWPWRPFLEGQFSRISQTFIPYALLGGSHVHERPTWLSKRLAVVLGVALSAACLIGSIFVRPRILFATLASFGFFWALPMRNTTYVHDFESIYYIGLPLVFFTIALLLARKMTNRDGVIAAASVIALLLFAASSFQMSRIGHSLESAQVARAAKQDLLAIREATVGEHVTVLNLGGDYMHFFNGAGYAMSYYLNQSFLRYGRLPPGDHGFVVMRERVNIDALLTPQNQYLFLYDAAGLTAWYRSIYRSVVSTEPAWRQEFDVYLINGTVYYLKEPCAGSNFIARLFLHVFPVALEDLPDDRRQHGFDNFDFGFDERGVIFDGKCLAWFVLPQYDISKIVTGRLYEAWGAVHHVSPPKLISAYQSIASNEPTARSEFDLYIDGGKLYYLKEPCERTDTAARFYLHVVPEDTDDLPFNRREHGFDNLDFDFDERGVIFDGKCLAAVPLPQYGIARITTGQFDGGGSIWSVVHHVHSMR